jgi:hypothetical protein
LPHFANTCLTNVFFAYLGVLVQTFFTLQIQQYNYFWIVHGPNCPKQDSNPGFEEKKFKLNPRSELPLLTNISKSKSSVPALCKKFLVIKSYF